MWLLGVALGAQPLVSVGETLGGAEVAGVEEHPEYVRIHLTLPDARSLQVEVTEGEQGGACAHHGHIVQPRWELLGESVEVEDQPAPVLAVCERLAERGEGLSLAVMPPEQQVTPEEVAQGIVPTPAQRPPRLRPLHGVLLALLVVLPAMLPGTRMKRGALSELALVAAVGVAARLLLSPRGLQIWDGWDRLVLALGQEGSHALFGDTYTAVMSVATLFSGGDFSVVYPVNLAIACLAPPLVWAVGWQLSGRRAALLAGLMMALLPAHLRLAGSEVMAVLVVTLSLLSVSCALRFVDRGETSAALAAALSAGLLVHTRPEAIPAALLPLLIAAGGAKKAPVSAGLGAVVAGGLLWMRLSNLALTEGVDTLNLEKLADPGMLLGRFIPAWSGMDASVTRALLPLQLKLTPVVWTVLALLAVRQKEGRWLVVWFVLAAGAVFSRTWPMHDLLRFHLLSMVPVVLLAGIGAERIKAPRALVAAGLALLALPHLPMVTRAWSVTEGWRVTVAAVEELPDNARLLFPTRNNRGPQLGAALAWLARDRPAVKVQDMRAHLDRPRSDQPVYALVTELCGAKLHGNGILPDPCAHLADGYILNPVHIEEIDAFSGSFVRHEAETLTVGLYRLTARRAVEESPGQ